MSIRGDRRRFLKTAGALGAGGLGAALAPLAAPALAQERRDWRMVTAWPANFPGLGTGAKLLARMIESASEGRIRITVYGAGEIVPAYEAIGAVASGSVEMGHGSPYYWKGKLEALQYLSAMPFGLTAQEQNAWLAYGGGQELADALYAELGCKFFAAGNTGVQMGGWFNREINTVDDLKGLKMRIPGLGGEVIRAAGGTPDDIPVGEIPAALQSGRLDASEFVGPYNDLAIGLYKSAKYYYYPGWHEPATVTDCFVNLDAWSKLPDDLKAIVAAAAAAVNAIVLSEFEARNNESLKVLVETHGVVLKRFSDEVLGELGRLSGEVLRDLTSRDDRSRKVFESLTKFRSEAMAWSKVADEAYLAARELPYAYAG